MVARIWHGKTSIENYKNYTDFLREIAIPDYKKTDGFKELTFVRNTEGEEGLASYLLEQCTDLRYIQELVGLENTKTTENYTHL